MKSKIKEVSVIRIDQDLPRPSSVCFLVSILPHRMGYGMLVYCAASHYPQRRKFHGCGLCRHASNTASIKPILVRDILGACFVNDLGTVIALGLIFAPFTYKTIIFIVVTIFLFSSLHPMIMQSFDVSRIINRCHPRKMGSFHIAVLWVFLALWSGQRTSATRLCPLEWFWQKQWKKTVIL